MALRTASLTTRRTSFSSEKRTSCLVGCTLTSTWCGAASTRSATGGAGAGARGGPRRRGGLHAPARVARAARAARRRRRVAARGHGRPVGVVYAPGQGLRPDPPAVHRDRLARAAGFGGARARGREGG